MRRLALLTVLAASAVTACRPEGAAAPAKAEAAPAPTAAPAPPRAASELDAAFRAAFGRPAPARRHVTRGEWGEADLAYRPSRLIELGQTTVLVSEGETEPCLRCFGALAVHYLRRTADGFEVVGAWPEIAAGAGFGAAPGWTLRHDLFGGAAIETEAGGTWQECAVTRADLVELTAEKPVVRAHGVMTGYSGRDGTLKGRIRPDGRGGFVADYAGGPAVRYVRDGEAFAPVGRPRLPSC